MRPEVERDVENAVSWYATRDPRLAVRLLEELDEAYTRILENPVQFPFVHKEVRRVLLDRFPYGVYYAVLEHSVEVIAVMSLRQHPDAWRLSKR